MKLDLSGKSITLAMVSDIKLEDSVKALLQCTTLCKFTDCKFFSSHDVSKNLPEGVKYIKIPPITSSFEYSKFMIKELNKHIETDYVLICQYDGFVVKPEAWSDSFLEYDYIGALCIWYGTPSVGNGGFSLRSKKLLNMIDDHQILFNNQNYDPEDRVICLDHRKIFERLGAKFPDLSVAKTFSWQPEKLHANSYEGQFGVHFGAPNGIPQDKYKKFYIQEVSGKPKAPKVSIVIPCYNHECFLRSCLDSILSQTFQDFEVIFVDDSSTDDSVGVASTYTDPRIRIIRQPSNKGPAAARNLGISNSSGDYILPVDSDNILKENCLEVFVKEIEQTPDQIIYCNIQNFGERDDISVMPEYSFKTLCNHNIMENCSMFSRDFWTDCGGYDENRLVEGFEDWEFWISMGKHNHFGRKISTELFLYRCRQGSLVSKGKSNSAEIVRYLRKKHGISN